jgi:4-oxalocrotonate tautomerase family enzyme
MPYVNVQITRGASRMQKAALVRDITDSLVRVLGKRPEHTHVVIQEIADEDWGFAGMLTDDWKAAQSETPRDASAAPSGVSARPAERAQSE